MTAAADWVGRFREEAGRGRVSRRTLAKVLTLIENRILEDPSDLLAASAHSSVRIGITGPPGAGKSTLVNGLAKRLNVSSRVGVLAVDPTSPFSGGAVLGDRIRMADVGNDVFIRSIASRDSLGGMTRTSYDLADILEAAGYSTILLETVGVGQSEIDIVRHADTVVVALVPESGDGVQALKAGLMEIADIFVVNKSDRAQADQMRQDITSAIQLRAAQKWIPPVVATVASADSGLDELVDQIRLHQRHLEMDGNLDTRRRERVRHRLLQEIEGWIHMRFQDDALSGEMATLIDALMRREMSYAQAVQKALPRLLSR